MVSLDVDEPGGARLFRSWCRIGGKYVCLCTSLEGGSGRDVPYSKVSLSFLSLGTYAALCKFR